MSHYSGWETTDPTPILAEHGAIALDNPNAVQAYGAKQKFRAGQFPPFADRSIPRNRELYTSAERVLESLSLIGELPTFCSGPGCKHSFSGSLREQRITLLIQAGDGRFARPMTYCPQCFESLYRKPLKVECDTQADEIWRLRSQGLTESEIAREIGTSQPTVSRLLSKSRRKPNSTTIN